MCAWLKVGVYTVIACTILYQAYSLSWTYYRCTSFTGSWSVSIGMLNKCRKEWTKLTQLLNIWLIDWLIHWLTERLNKHRKERTKLQTLLEFLVGCLLDWQNDWVSVAKSGPSCHTFESPIDWLIDWLKSVKKCGPICNSYWISGLINQVSQRVGTFPQLLYVWLIRWLLYWYDRSTA